LAAEGEAMKVSAEIETLWNCDGKWRRAADPGELTVESEVDGDDVVSLRFGGVHIAVDGHELIAAVEKAIGLGAIRRGSRR
jgi:hypothetical protein